jgi:hypothetical protein
VEAHITAIIDELVNQITLGGSVVLMVSAILAIVAIIATLGAATPAIVTLVGLAIEVGGSTLATIWDSAAKEKLRCLLFCLAIDGQWSDLEAVKVEIVAQLDPLVYGIITHYLDTVGLVGLNNAATMGGIATADCSGCDCAPSEECLCEDCVSGTSVTIQDNLLTYQDNTGSHDFAAYGSRASVRMLGDCEAIVQLAEPTCIKQVSVTTYEASAHDTALSIIITVNGIDNVVTWSQPSVGWYTRSYIFTTPVCDDQIRIRRNPTARAKLYIDTVLYTYCAKL